MSTKARTARDPAAPAGPPESVTGPVVPTATASGTHQPLTGPAWPAGRLLPADTPITAIAVPYFQWDNRDGGPMRVWVPR